MRRMGFALDTDEAPDGTESAPVGPRPLQAPETGLDGLPAGMSGLIPSGVNTGSGVTMIEGR